MKDIHEVKDTQPLSFNHVRCRSVAARAGSVHLIYSMDRKWGGHTRNSTLKDALTDHRKPTGTMPLVQHSLDKAHNNVNDIPHHNHTTYFLRGWSKSTSTLYWLPLLRPDCVRHSTTSSTNWEGPCHANRGWRGKGQRSRRVRVRHKATSTGPASRAQL